MDWGGWEQLGLQHARLCQVNTHLETRKLVYLIYSNVLGFRGRMLEQKKKKSDSFRARESATTTNSEVNHLFNVTLGADFLGKVWPCRKKGNASNSNEPEACYWDH